MQTYSRHTCRQAVSRLADRQQAGSRQTSSRQTCRQAVGRHVLADMQTGRHTDIQTCRQAIDKHADRQ